jgi:hypothetical protein
MSVLKRKAVLRRAFDKAVRRKPLAFAADAGLWDSQPGRDCVASERALLLHDTTKVRIAELCPAGIAPGSQTEGSGPFVAPEAKPCQA